MNHVKALAMSLLCAAAFGASLALAADRPYAAGSVWTVTFVKVKPGMDSVYLRDLAANWKRVMDEAKKQQLIVSYKILEGPASARDDWNMMLLVESKNWAAFDGADDKFDAIMEKLVGPEKTQMESLIKRGEVREIVGVRNFQEMTFR